VGFVAFCVFLVAPEAVQGHYQVMTTARLPAAVRDLLRGAGTADADLLARFVAGRDEAAFAELVRRHGGPVWDVCRTVLRNAADADDAFQATFLTLARRAAYLRKPSSVGAWLHGVAVRVARKIRAAASRRQAREAEYEPVPAADPGECDVRAVVHEALAALPARYREPLVACYLRGLTHDDTAAELGLSKAAVKKRLERGRDRLREALGKRGLGPALLLVATAAPAPAHLLDAATRLAAGAAPVPPAILRLVEGAVPMTLAKFTAALVLAAGVGLAVAAQEGTVRQPKEPPPTPGPAAKRPLRARGTEAPDAKNELEGAWTVTLIETNGAPIYDAKNRDETLPAPTFVFTGEKCEVKGVRVLYLADFRFETDPTAKPKEIDATMLDGPKKGNTVVGIYLVRDDELRVCLRLQGSELGRPKGYVTNSGTTLYTFVLTRGKKTAATPPPELRFDEVLRTGNKLYLVLNDPTSKSFPDELAPFAQRLDLAVKTADRVKDKELTVVLFRRIDQKTGVGSYSGFSRDQLGRYAAEEQFRRIDRLAEHAWTIGRLPKDATPLPPEPPQPQPKLAEPVPDVSARVVVRSDWVPPEPAGDFENARVDRYGYLELVGRGARVAGVRVAPSHVRVTTRNSSGSTHPPVDLPQTKDGEAPDRPRTVDVPAGVYVGLNTQSGQGVVLRGRPTGADVHIGTRVWRLPPGRYRVSGETEVSFADRPVTLRLEPTAFTIP